MIFIKRVLLHIGRKLSWAMILLAVVIASGWGPAQAQDSAGWPPAIVATPDAPAHLDYCTAILDGEQWHVGFDVTNDSKVDLKAVRVRFAIYDAFGSLLQNQDVTEQAEIAPGERLRDSALDDHHGWTIGKLRMPAPSEVSKVTCSILKTLDVNGNTWLAK